MNIERKKKQHKSHSRMNRMEWSDFLGVLCAMTQLVRSTLKSMCTNHFDLNCIPCKLNIVDNVFPLNSNYIKSDGKWHLCPNRKKKGSRIKSTFIVRWLIPYIVQISGQCQRGNQRVDSSEVVYENVQFNVNCERKKKMFIFATCPPKRTQLVIVNRLNSFDRIKYT